MDVNDTQTFVDQVWDATIVPTLVDYIRIPNKSPDFDSQWAEHGYMDQAVELIFGWLQQHKPEDATLEVVKLEGRTPLIFMEIPGQVDDTVVLYGHLDKQPEMTGWAEGKGPWLPVIEDGKLYGRGGADDGYAAFASLTAINALRAQGVPHARCVMIIEGCEESGSYDLPAYIDHLADRIGTPSLVVCLDSGAGNYAQMWNTTSLRGLVGGTLRVDIVREGVHSGDASGTVADSFRIIRMLLDRLEDPTTGLTRLDALKAEVPEARVRQNALAAEVLGHGSFPFVEGAEPVHADPAANHLARTWQTTLSITGVDGLPPLERAGNVLRPFTALKLSMRIPPSIDGATAYAAVKAELERDPPYGAQVSFEGDYATGWDAPPMAEWLHASATRASEAFYGQPMMYMGEGGTIPFMGMLGEKFPEAQFLITGVLGPESNAHGPNEFLHIPFAKKLTACVVQVLADHATR
ncbi:MAG: M20/M25/M40 family metallo-hydrolase [Bradymonadia bacterium]